MHTAESLDPPAIESLGQSRSATPSHHGPLQIGFLGLGTMGYYMARNLATHPQSRPPGSLPLVVFNRTADKARSFQSALGTENVRIADSVGQLAVECDVIITNLATDEVVLQIYREFAVALSATQDAHAKNKIFIETSTTYPSVAGELDSMISVFPRCHLVTSPVFGRPPAADKAQLLVAIAGNYRAKKRAIELLVPAVARRAFDMGQNLEKAPMMKLIGNSTLLGCIEVIGEAFTLADKAEIDAENVYTLLEDFLPAAPLLLYGRRMIDGSFDGLTGFSLEGGIKDSTHMQNLASALSCPMPVVDIALQHYLTAKALHQAQILAGSAEYKVLDNSALIAGSRVAAGLDGLTSSSRLVKDS